MHEFNTDKLYINYRDEYAYSRTVIPRRYTLTHDDVTAELFLTVGADYARDKIPAFRDEVLGEWIYDGSQCYFYAYVHVDGQNFEESAIRNDVFRRELPLALKAIRYGDSHIFHYYPQLDQVPILLHFQSQYEQFSTIENYQTFADYAVEIRYS